MLDQLDLTIGGQTKRSTLGQHPVSINIKTLPEAALNFIVAYGLRQYLADAMAGAENEADAKARIEARRAKLVAGDMSRTRGEAKDAPDTEGTRALKLAKQSVRTQAKARNVTLTKEQVQSAAEAWVAKNPKWLAEAKAQLAAEAKVAASVDQDEADEIFADLTKGSAVEESEGGDENADDTGE